MDLPLQMGQESWKCPGEGAEALHQHSWTDTALQVRAWLRARQTHPSHARPTQPRCAAPCRGGEQNFIVESGKAALAIPRFGVTFMLQTAGKAARGRFTLLLFGPGGRAWTLPHGPMLHPRTQTSPQCQGRLYPAPQVQPARYVEDQTSFQCSFQASPRSPLQQGAHSPRPQATYPSRLRQPCSSCQRSSSSSGPAAHPPVWPPRNKQPFSAGGLQRYSATLQSPQALGLHNPHRRICVQQPSCFDPQQLCETCLPASSWRADLTPWFLPLTAVWHKANGDGTGKP